MKKILILTSLISTILSANAYSSESFDCRNSDPTFQDMAHILTIDGTDISVTFRDEVMNEDLVKDAPCDLLPTGNGKMSLICTDELGASMNIIFDRNNLNLEVPNPWGDRDVLNCSKL
jgi:hypothetical protein